MPTRRSVWPHAAALAVLVPLLCLLPGCGGSEADRVDMRVDDEAAMDTTPAGTPAPPALPVVARDAQRQVAVTLSERTLIAEREAISNGEVTFQVTNTGAMPHALAIDGNGVEQRTDALEPGGARNLTVDLEPGTYRLFCPDTVDGEAHAHGGMSAPFVVR